MNATGSDGDSPVLPELLDQIPAGEQISTGTADGACDTRRCHTAIIDRQATAIIQIRIALRNCFNALGSAKIVRVAQAQRGKGKSGGSCATTPVSAVAVAADEFQPVPGVPWCLIGEVGQLRITAKLFADELQQETTRHLPTIHQSHQRHVGR